MKKSKEFIVFGAPDIRKEEIDEVIDSMKSGWIGTGPKVARFEADFAMYKGVSNRSKGLPDFEYHQRSRRLLEAMILGNKAKNCRAEVN